MLYRILACIKNVLLISSLPVLLLVAGCSSSDSSGGVTARNDDQGDGIELPVAINAGALPSNGSLNAYISVDGGPRQALAVDLATQTVSGSLNGISTGSHQFLIEVVFAYDNGTEVMLGRASVTMDVGSGDNSLTVNSGDYNTTFDDDNDGVSNLAELNAGTDPTNPADTDCVIGTSAIGNCVIGQTI